MLPMGILRKNHHLKPPPSPGAMPPSGTGMLRAATASSLGSAETQRPKNMQQSVQDVTKRLAGLGGRGGGEQTSKLGVS